VGADVEDRKREASEKDRRKDEEKSRDAMRSDIAPLQDILFHFPVCYCRAFSAFSSFPFYSFFPSFHFIFSSLLTTIIHPQSSIETELG